jgi:hypothetical protein
MQSTPGCPLVPGRPLHIGRGGVQLTFGIPFVPLPLQIGAFLLVQFTSGTSASAPIQVGRTPAAVVI